MGKVILVVVVVTLVSIMKYWKDLKENMYKNYPLEVDVMVKIDREQMNKNYYNLSHKERAILEFTTGSDYTAFLNRGIKNELVLTIIKGERKEKWVICSDEAINYWIIYLKKGYFKKVEITEQEY